MSYYPTNQMAAREPHAFKQGIFSGLGQDPLTCPPPKWTYDAFMNRCACAPGYAPTPDGLDCIPLVSQQTSDESYLAEPVQTPGTIPQPMPPTTQPAAAPCDGTSIGGHCVPTWALIGGGLLVGVILLKVL